MKKRPIPNNVDEQMQIFLWEADEFMPALAIFIIMFMYGQTLLGIVLSLLFVKLLQKYKAANLAGSILHTLWWSGLFRLNKVFPDGSKRELIK